MGITAAGATALAIGASGALSAGASMYGASQAAGAAKDAAGLQQGQYQTTRGDLAPYFQPGYNALSGASALSQLGPTGGGPDFLGAAYSNIPGKMTQEELEATPGYQFDRSQGLKAVQSAAASRGLGLSGASLKGAANFATGLANKTYLDQFNIRQKGFENLLNLNTGQQTNLTNQFDRYNKIATLGANAAAGLGTQGATLANQEGKYINAAGIDTSTGLTNATNALSSGVNNYLGYDAYLKGINRNNPAAAPATTLGYTMSGTNPINLSNGVTGSY
jgi:hypothetical protein